MMNAERDLLVLLEWGNPIPDLDDVDAAEAAAALRGIEEAWAAETSSARSAVPRRGWLRPAVVAASFVLALAAIGLPLWLLGDRDPESDATDQPQPATTITNAPTTTAAQPSTPTTTLPAPPTTTPAQTAAVPAMSWQRIPDQPPFQFGDLSTAWSRQPPSLRFTTGGPGLVAVGTVDGAPWPDDSGITHGAVWVSADGLTWERAGDPAIFEGEAFPRGVGISDVATGPEGRLVAVGNHGADGVVWTSDDGLSWTRIDDEALGGAGSQIPTAVTAGGPGWVAVGWGDMDALVWVSDDGFDWTQVDDDDLLGSDGPAQMRDIARGGPGLVAVGSIGFSQAGGRPAIWVSVDGLDWERLPDEDIAADRSHIEPVADGVLERVSVDPTTGRAVAIGWGSYGGVWTSPDGRAWSAVEGSDRNGDYPYVWAGMAWDGEWLLAAAENGFWISPDAGVTWDRVGPQEETVAPDIVMFGSRFVAVGTDVTPRQDSAVLWILQWEE